MSGFNSKNIRKAFFLRKYKSFLIIELEISNSENIRNFFGMDFFIFWAWAEKCAR